MFVQKLLQEIKSKGNSCVVGLDPTLEMMPDKLKRKYLLKESMEEIAQIFWEFNKTIIDYTSELTPCIKVQIAFYERYGLPGLEVFYKTLDYCKEKGLMTIADVKRGDIGSTAKAYAQGFLTNPSIDSITVNPYFGSDGLLPFVEETKGGEKGLFILVKTSNPSSKELQDIKTEDGQFLYDKVANLVSSFEGDYTEFSHIGSVVGGTHREHLKRLREKLKGFILVPGYGTQGGKGEDIKYAFNSQGYGALVCSSRGITEHYKKIGEENYGLAAKISLKMMIEDINREIEKGVQ